MNVRACIKMLRPTQWTKNGFLLLPILFGNAFSHWTVSQILLFSGSAFAAFCCWSSTVYILNDILDRKTDALHPRKKNRPIASGKVSVPAALCIAIFLAFFPFVLFLLPASVWPFAVPEMLRWVPLAGLCYLVNSILYCLFFKHQVLLDVFSIALGFVIRVTAGCLALDLRPSNWILLCTFSLALYLGFGKRQMEIACLKERPGEFRPVLKLYSREYLNFLLGISGAVCLISYLFYTLSPATHQLHHTDGLIFTVPFVFYGIFKYAQDAMLGTFDGPDEVLFRDRAFFINALLWGACSTLILYGRTVMGLF